MEFELLAGGHLARREYTRGGERYLELWALTPATQQAFARLFPAEAQGFVVNGWEITQHNQAPRPYHVATLRYVGRGDPRNMSRAEFNRARLEGALRLPPELVAKAVRNGNLSGAVREFWRLAPLVGEWEAARLLRGEKKRGSLLWAHVMRTMRQWEAMRGAGSTYVPHVGSLPTQTLRSLGLTTNLREKVCFTMF